MAKTRIKLNPGGMAALLKDPGVLADLQARAERVAAAAGEGHVASSMIGRNRARASVITDSFPARYREAKRGNLSKALGAAGG